VSQPVIGVDLRALVGAPSGIGVFTLALLSRLAEQGRADYLGMAHAPVAAAQELSRLGVRIEHHPAPLGVIWQQLLLPRRLRRGDVDLFWSPLLTLPPRLEIPSVVTVHDLTPLLYPETHSLKVRLSILPFLRRTLDEAGRVVVDSESTAADLRIQFPDCAQKIRVVYPGVDAVFRPGEKDDISTTRHEIGCSEGYILHVGTIEPRKNIAFLLDAWEALRRADPTTPPLVLVGAYGWRSRALLSRIRRLERTGGLIYLDRVDRSRLVLLLQAASIFVLPSLYEGFGLPAAEAMACGIPTVVTATSSLPEVVGQDGLTVELGDASGLARAMQRLWNDRALARALGARGRKRAQRFDWGRAAEAMERIFEEALR